MSVEVINCQQGSREWHDARTGVITASMFGTIMDKAKTGANKGGWKKAAYDYAFRLAVERISGEPLDEGFQTWAMARGHELEPEARSLHELRIDSEIVQAGFVKTADGKFGASADGLIGDTEGCEYKAFIAPEKIRSIILDGDIEDYLPQCHGGLWLTGRKRWHFGLYCPALRECRQELTIYTIERDEDYIASMEQDLLAFDGLVEKYRERLLKKGGLEPAEIPTVDPVYTGAAGAFGGRNDG